MENNEKDVTVTENEDLEEEEQGTKEEIEDASAEPETPEDDVEVEIKEVREELEEAKARTLRIAAEFDNFKKRTAKEKDELYSTAVCETVNNFLPVLDNLERAVGTLGENSDASAVSDGVKMILKQFCDVLASLGVEKIETDGGFNPELHNAVMHVEDEGYGENEIAEELMSGYKYKGKVIRHSMVKVAN